MYEDRQIWAESFHISMLAQDNLNECVNQFIQCGGGGGGGGEIKFGCV